MSWSFVFERSWQSGKVSEGVKKADVTPILKKTYEDLRNYRLVNPLILGKVVGPINLKNFWELKKNKKVIGHRLALVKRCLANSSIFYEEMTT